MSGHTKALGFPEQFNDSELITYVAIPHNESSRTSQSGQSPDIHTFVRLLRKRKKLILGCGVGAALLGVLYCTATPALYTADTVLELRGYAPVLSSIQSENLFGTDSRKIEYQKTTMAKLKLEGLADAVLSRDGLHQRLREYWQSREGIVSKIARHFKRLYPSTTSAAHVSKPPKQDPYFLHRRNEIQKYLSLIDIEPVHETSLVHIRATTQDKKLSQSIANTHATAFIEHLRQERLDSIQSNIQLLQAQAHDLKDRVTSTENQLNAYASQNKLLLVRNNESNTISNRHIESLTQMLADAVGRRIKSESALTHARKNREDEGSFLDNEITNQLRANLKQAETEYATLGSQVTAAYPGMRELSAKIASLKRAIKDERNQGIQALQRQFDADEANESSLRRQIEHEKERAQEVAKQLIQYDVLSKEAASLRDLYQAVLKQAKEIEMSAAVTTSNVAVVDYAGLPTAPSAPKTNLIIIILTFVGLTSGLLMAYILESLADTISSPDELQETLDLPIIGSIPNFGSSAHSTKRLGHTPGAALNAPTPSTEPPPNPDNYSETIPTENKPSAETTTPQMITISAPHSAISEALRTIRANVLLSSADYPPRVIMMASSIQGEGKTTILANLAVTLAQAKHRTLIIDADLRMAGLSLIFREANSEARPGLSDLLTRQLPLEGTVHSTSVDYLDILPSGTKAPNPAELVGSESMKRLLAGLKDRYDFILVDTPPVMAVADALLISRAVDSVLFVVRSGVTPRPIAREARQKLVHVKARIIGVILNDVSSSHHMREAVKYGANYIELS
jgi:capsular exopolysaccharide synthesis family protein